jgi:cytoskeletal protein CcmA (bactofilin family)
MVKEYDCYIDSDSFISGFLKSKQIGIEGIHFGSGTAQENISVSQNGVFNGNMDSKEVTIEGVAKGFIHASGSVTLNSQAKIDCNIVSSKLIVQEGAQVNGFFIISPNQEERQKLQKSRKVETASLNTVTISIPLPKAKQVSVIGSFNNWNRNKPIPMTRWDDQNWTVNLTLTAGTYEYLIVVDGKEQPDPTNPEKTKNSFGGENSVLTIS